MPIPSSLPDNPLITPSGQWRVPNLSLVRVPIGSPVLSFSFILRVRITYSEPQPVSHAQHVSAQIGIPLAAMSPPMCLKVNSTDDRNLLARKFSRAAIYYVSDTLPTCTYLTLISLIASRCRAHLSANGTTSYLGAYCSNRNEINEVGRLFFICISRPTWC
jgi:hypothetical protein